MKSSWQTWVLTIVGAVIASVSTAHLTGAQPDPRVPALELRVDRHDAELKALGPTVARIDERTLAMLRELERIAKKLDEEEPKRGRTR